VFSITCLNGVTIVVAVCTILVGSITHMISYRHTERPPPPPLCPFPEDMDLELIKIFGSSATGGIECLHSCCTTMENMREIGSKCP